MKATITQVTAKIKKEQEGSTDGVEAIGVEGQIEVVSQSELLFVCDPHQSLGNSHAKVEGVAETSQIYHHVTCKDLGFQKKEVVVTHIKTQSETSIYKLKVL